MNDTALWPDLDSPYALQTTQIEAFHRDGCIKLKQVLSPDTLAHFGREITRLTIDLNTESRPLAERSTYDRAFLQVMNLWERSALVARFVMGQRLARIAAELLAVRGVRLYHDQSLYKEPGGGITPAHADQYYWPLASDRTITAWIPLQAVPAEMGPLGFYAGSQGVAFGRDLGISDESEARITENMARHGFPFEVGPFELGEIDFEDLRRFRHSFSGGDGLAIIGTRCVQIPFVLLVASQEIVVRCRRRVVWKALVVVEDHGGGFLF